MIECVKSIAVYPKAISTPRPLVLKSALSILGIMDNQKQKHRGLTINILDDHTYVQCSAGSSSALGPVS